MRKLILDQDLKSLFTGAAAAVTAGLIAGGVMYPDLRGPGDLGGPQLKAGVAGTRTYDQSALTSWASYDGKVPDYVIGTDWLKPPQYAQEVYAEEPPPRDDPVMVYEADTGDAVDADLRVQEPEREPVSYPSTAGGVPYGADLPKPPAPPAEGEAETADLHSANPG